MTQDMLQEYDMDVTKYRLLLYIYIYINLFCIPHYKNVILHAMVFS